MPSLRQLELVFRSTGTLPVGPPGVSPGELIIGPPGETLPGPQPRRPCYCKQLASCYAPTAQHESRTSFTSNGIRISKTAAGRADYRQKLISLNPRLVEHPTEIDRTLRHELAHILAQFRADRRRIPPHGVEWRQACIDLGIADEKRCHNLPFPARTYAARIVYRCPKCLQEFPRVRRVRRVVACLACCRKHNGGEFDPRFRLQLLSSC